MKKTLVLFLFLTGCADPASEDYPEDDQLPPEMDVAEDGGAAVACAPVWHQRFEVKATTLGCAGAPEVDLINVDIPVFGQAVAKANLTFKNNAFDQQGYYWSANLRIGDAKIATPVGGDICANANTGLTSVIGAGKLTEAGNRLQIVARQGAIQCYPGTVALQSGGYVDVWVEDPRAECSGRDLFATSLFAERGVAEWDWATALYPIAQLEVPITEPSRLRVMSSAEGTPVNNPSAGCGDASNTLESRVLVDEATVGSDKRGTPGPTWSMSHTVLATEALSTSLLPSKHTVALQVARNYSYSRVFTGGCCGDAVLAVVREPAPDLR